LFVDRLAYLQSLPSATSGDPLQERDFGTLPGLIEPTPQRAAR